MTDAQRRHTLELGPHHARFEPPDVVFVSWNGRSNAEDIEALYTWTEEILEDGTRQFVVADMTNLETATAAARKVAASDPRSRNIAGVAILGASFHVRVLMGMFMKALRLFYGERLFRMEFFTQEDEALAWVDSERARRAATSG